MVRRKIETETIESLELELREVAGEKRLRGTLIQEGRVASRRAEVFAPGSIRWPGDGIGILTGHRQPPEVRAMPVRSPDGEIQISARTTPAILEAVQAGKTGLSVEFYSLLESRNASGVREIQEAMVTAGALVSSPEYAQGQAEVRQTRRFRFWL